MWNIRKYAAIAAVGTGLAVAAASPASAQCGGWGWGGGYGGWGGGYGAAGWGGYGMALPGGVDFSKFHLRKKRARSRQKLFGATKAVGARSLRCSTDPQLIRDVADRCGPSFLCSTNAPLPL